MQLSFLIQKSPDQRLFASFPELIAGYHVFRRLSMPRHPPDTLSSLTTFIDHRRNGNAEVGTTNDEQKLSSHSRASSTIRSPGVVRRNRRSITGSLSPKRCST